MRIILIGNYLPDKQESMIRFAQMLHLGFSQAGYACEIWWPSVFFGKKTKNTFSGIGKWLAYLDKWILFPWVLRWRILNESYRGPKVRFHVCDHSNAPYLNQLPKERTAITCHDVIAIRAGLGYQGSYTEASKLGKYLQKWILQHLSEAKLIAAVSHFTLSQLRDLVPEKKANSKGWQVIHNAFNAPFQPMEKNEAYNILRQAGLDPSIPFVLHVGSDLPRKNRQLLVMMVSELGTCWNGNICFAGDALDSGLLTQANSLGLKSRINILVKPDHQTLVALYSTCQAFIFPSFSEGFGWPLIEAQACGAPVIASDVAPMPEVSGRAAFHADPNDPQAFANLLNALNDKAIRTDLITKGFENAKRFELTKIINAYLKLHGLAATSW